MLNILLKYVQNLVILAYFVLPDRLIANFAMQKSSRTVVVNGTEIGHIKDPPTNKRKFDGSVGDS